MVQNPPEGTPRVAPYLLYEDAGAALTWLCDAFGFVETERLDGPNGVTHAEVGVGDARIMLGHPGPDFQNPTHLGAATHNTYVYVDDIDAHFAHAKAAGATILQEVEEQFYGDKRYGVADPEGHVWYFAEHVRDVSPEEMQVALDEMAAPVGDQGPLAVAWAPLMRVLLASTYEMGHQPLGLAAPAATLRGAGFQVDCLDLSVDAPDAEVVAAAELVAISVPMHTAARLGMKYAETVRAQNAAAHIAFYGLYASTLSELLDASGLADSVIGGEYEPALLSVAEALRDGRPTRDIPGLNGSPQFPRQTFDVPDRSGLLSMEGYGRFAIGESQALAGYVEATRGCAHTCTHCPITPVYEGRLRLVQQETVLADIDQQVAAGVGHITFGDPDFLNAREHSLAIVEELHRRHPDVTFDVTIKVEHILEHRDVFPQFGELGAAFVTSAFESVDDAILSHFEKGHTAADLQSALDITRDAGLTLRPTWVAFTPWTTIDGFISMLDFIESNGLVHHVQPVQYALRLLIPPGSPLIETVRADGLLGDLNEAELTYRWSSRDEKSQHLQRVLARIVEEADGSDHLRTFAAVKRAAMAAATGIDAPVEVLEQPRAAVPGLTEAWFC